VKLGSSQRGNAICRFIDLVPLSYPIVSLFERVGLAVGVTEAARSGVEPWALRNATSRCGLKVEALAVGVCQPSFECGCSVLWSRR
jgi:hypothetical protein